MSGGTKFQQSLLEPRASRAVQYRDLVLARAASADHSGVEIVAGSGCTGERQAGYDGKNSRKRDCRDKSEQE